MVEKNYIINGVNYKVKSKYLKEDDLYEVILVDFDGNIWTAGYGENIKEAYKEFEERLSEKGIKPGIDNKYVPWDSLSPEVRRKIQVYAKRVVMELSGEWLTEEERFRIFRNRVLSWTTKEYGYTTPINYQEYKKL